MSYTYNNNNRKNQVKISVTGRAPHTSKKRIRNKIIENSEYLHFKINLGGLAVAFVIWFSFEGDSLLKAITGLVAIISSCHYWKSKEEE